MAYTVLIEQPAKNIKLADGIVLTVLNCRIMVRLWGMYLSLAANVCTSILARIAIIRFLTVRV